MNEKQQIRAEAIKIAALLKKPEDVAVIVPGDLSFSPEFWTLVKAVEKHLEMAGI
jgi:precorrin-2 methylase